LSIGCVILLTLSRSSSVSGQDPPPIPPPPVGPVHRSTDFGVTWASTKPGLSRQAYFITSSPGSPGVLYAGTDQGVSKSTDRGDHWVQSPGTITLFFVVTIAVDPLVPTTVYAGGGCYAGGGVLKSKDAGLTWTLYKSDFTWELIEKLIIDPENRSTIYALDDVNLWKSVDRGKHWFSCLSYPNPGDNIFSADFVLDSSHPSTLYVAGNAHLYKSTNAGDTWVDITNRISVSGLTQPLALKMNPVNSSEIFAEGFNGTAKTTNGGDTWARFDDETSRLFYGVVAYSASPSIIYSSNSLSLSRSTDQGKTWVSSLLPEFGDNRFCIDSGDPAILYWEVPAQTKSTDEPSIRGFSIAGNGLFISGSSFDVGAVILLNGEEQPTANDKQSPTDTLFGKTAGKRIRNDPDTKIQVRNANGKLSQEVTYVPLANR
jgi:photosystem II stability/assembly factor-like uncharacterized protein